MSNTTFVITGYDVNNKRFNPIYTNTPQHYNIYRGNIWKIINGRRKLIKRIYN